MTCERALVCLSGICVGDEEANSPADGGGNDGSTQGGSGGSMQTAGDAGPDSGDAAVNECPALDPPAQGNVTVPGTKQGDVAAYGCEPSFGLVGVASRTCQSDGTWSGEAPSCAPGDCPSLTSPEDGTVTTAKGTVAGESAVFACESGHQLIGDAMRTCQADGSWSGADPLCIPVDCGALTAPAEGAVDTAAGTAFGATATYSCNEGRELTAAATRTCQSDRSWSGGAPECAPVDCGALDPPTSGTVDTAGGTRLGAVASYGCTDGYGLVGVQTRTCQADGMWSDSAPSCAIGNCPTLLSPINGTVSTPMGTTVGAMATYSCNAGYMSTGDLTRTCQSDNTWSGSMPGCSIVTCPVLAPPTNGWVTAGRSYGTTVTYSCQVGYYLDGNQTRSCQANGSWTWSDPTCPDANTEGLRLQQLHVGNDEFVVIKNTGAATATLKGLRLEVLDVGTTYSLNFGYGSIAGGATKKVGDGLADFPLPMNLAAARAAAILLCGANPCDNYNVIDAFTYEGGGVPPALPAGVGADAPVYWITGANDDEEDFYRVRYRGRTPGGLSSCDWAIAPKPPIFAEHFACDAEDWTTYGGTWFSESTAAPDGSGAVMRQHSGTTDVSNGLGYVFPAAVFPTHIEYWQRGGNRTYLCATTDGCAGAAGIGATVYSDNENNLCWSGPTLSCLDQGEAWDFVELDNIDWDAGTLSVKVNGVPTVSSANPPASPRFLSGYVAGSGLRRIVLTGGSGTWDGIRMW